MLTRVASLQVYVSTKDVMCCAQHVEAALHGHNMLLRQPKVSAVQRITAWSQLNDLHHYNLLTSHK